MKIGVFDSGIGGVTVLTALRKRFPGVEFVYLGDTANVPYGTKSPSQIKSLAANAVASFAPRQLDALVVACNTASSLALDEIMATLPKVPVFGVVEAGVRATLDAHRAFTAAKTVLILATRATARSGIYSRLLTPSLGATTQVVEQACPLLVPIIEEGLLDHPLLHLAIHEYVLRHSEDRAPGIALLACTHYPWIKKAFERALPGWQIVDSANAVAALLEEALPQLKQAGNGPSKTEWLFTDPDVVPKFVFEA